MHIKQVIIEGFKSYREQVATEPFDPHHNCVVGANGSGKTNFFQAIRFVLSDLFSSLSTEDRQALLHEGAGHAVLSAFVEIVFDNSDNRIPVDREEVCLRRTIGLKKDEYFLDKKHITKEEVKNLLESAGFSRSNPYYVVQQGKVASLTTMKDAERLDLLKEIGGTRVYEERRRESLRIMQETEARRQQILQVVTYIDERLHELDEEKEELAKYQRLDKQRRAVEYTILDKELADTRVKMEQVEEARQQVSLRSSSVNHDMVAAHDSLRAMEKELKGVRAESSRLEKRKEALDAEREQLIRARAKADLDVKELEEKAAADTKARAALEQQLKGVAAEVARARQQKAAVQPRHEQQLQEEKETAHRIEASERQLNSLYEKQGRSAQFATKEALDTHLRKQIKQVTDTLAGKDKQIQDLRAEIQSLNTTVGQLSAQEQEAGRAQEERKKLLDDAANEVAALQQQIHDLTTIRKDLWEQENKTTEKSRTLKDEMKKKEKSLDMAASPEVNRSLRAARDIIRKYNIQGVHGTLLELMDCNPRFYTAVDAVGKNSFFNLVVETSDVAQRIIHYMNQERAGRISFFPLDALRPQAVTYPQTNEAMPLIRKIEGKPQFQRVFDEVFGKVLLCKDIDVAGKLAADGTFDCVTLEGDQVLRKGTMNGGYRDPRKSAMLSMSGLREVTAQLEQVAAESDKLSRALADTDARANTAMGEKQKREAALRHMRSGLDQQRDERQQVEARLRDARDSLKAKEAMLRDMEESRAGLQQQLEELERELGADFYAGLSADERAQLARLNPDIARLKDELVSMRTTRMATETELQELETVLATNLVKREGELKAQLEATEARLQAHELEVRARELRTLSDEVADVTRQQKELDEAAVAAHRRILELTSKIDDQKTKEQEQERHLQDEAKEMESLLHRRNLLHQKREDLMKKIRDLGSLPSDAFEKYGDKSLKELHALLHRCGSELKKYGHVNKKALDQYVNFTEQREELIKRQVELDKGDEKIRELISVLDLRKDEAIERTFKGVAKHFREIFAELVPNGTGSLVMQKKRLAEEGEAEEANGEAAGPSEPPTDGGRIEKYSGVKVKVSFGHGETMSMNQLSGGQKTVVALALIFAIQRCDPAPFYLFDEIDAALDPVYRTAVANMIHRQAVTTDTQFITTTFRPELVKVCQKIYGVLHTNRVSRVQVISHEEALEFIEHEEDRRG
eukprot:jgi/Mesvir1/3362/Mv04256-RA.1